MPSHALPLDFDIHIAVLTPKTLLPSVWPFPLSLATTSGISVDFFSSPYLDVSVRVVPLIRLCIQRMMTVRYHRRIAPFRNPWIDAYLRLPMAYRSLSRLSSAPSAKAFALRPCSLDHFTLVMCRIFWFLFKFGFFVVFYPFLLLIKKQKAILKITFYLIRSFIVQFSRCNYN